MGIIASSYLYLVFCYNRYMKKTLLIIFVLVLVLIGFKYLGINPKVPIDSQMTLINKAEYVCDAGKTIGVSFYEGPVVEPSTDPNAPPVPNGRVVVNLSDGRNLTLNQTISGSGVRYANEDESFVFWNKGNGALVLENNQEKSYIGCITVALEPEGSGLSKVYSNSSMGFSLRLPGEASPAGDYKVDESYVYDLRPGQRINGVKFTIPESLTQGTNLSKDSYISIEEIPQTEICSAGLFVDGLNDVQDVTNNDMTYSFTSSSGAGAGNRYEESVFALPGTNPCLAIRYFIHSTAVQNYEPGTVEEFDKDALLNQFNQIRDTLTIN